MAILVLILILFSFLLFKLGTLNQGASIPEVKYISSVDSGRKLLADPLFLMHKIPTYVLIKLNIGSIAAYRLVSVFFAALAAGGIFMILRHAFSSRTAVFGSSLFMSSAWTLHIGRTAMPEATFFLIIPLLIVAVWLEKTSRHQISIIVLSCIIALTFYVPGFWLLLLAIIIWERSAIIKALATNTLWIRILCSSIIIVGLAPLVWATIQTPSLVLSASGLPTQLPTIQALAKNLISIPANLFIFGPADPARWLGRLPILDMFSAVMMTLGIYSLRFHIRKYYVQLLLMTCIVLLLVITAGGLVTISALIPLVYLFIAAGIAFMLQQWLSVFPKNPLANFSATAMISVVVLLVIYFHINQYFVAWPQAPLTRRVFGNTLLK